MRYFTAESVAPGHPDKIADQISDAILDAYLAQDPLSRVAVETAIKDRHLFILGEVTSKAEGVDPTEIARNVLRSIGHTDDRWQMAADDMNITVHLSQQSPNIAAGVDSTTEIGAGDQGMMYGYATDESDSYLPLALHYAHALLQQYNLLRDTQLPQALGPDAKSQVTVAYHDDGTVSHIDTVVISAQHDAGLGLDALRNLIENSVIRQIIPAELITEQTRFLINPAGEFVLGGSVADAGLTGRKIIVDSYGGGAPHGGGAFCFQKGTLVHTAEGIVPIEQIAPGTLVRTRNEATGLLEYKPVVARFDNPPEKHSEILDLTLENGEVISVTPQHEIFTKQRGWITAAELQEGDELMQ